MSIKIAQPYRCPGEYSAYKQGAEAAAEALGYRVDAESWGGGIPQELTLYQPSAEAATDVYEAEAENAEVPDPEPFADSEGAEADSEPLPFT